MRRFRLFLSIAFVLGFAWFFYWSKRKINDRIGEEDDLLSIEEEFNQVTGPKKFSYRDLVRRPIILQLHNCLGKGVSEKFMKAA